MANQAQITAMLLGKEAIVTSSNVSPDTYLTHDIANYPTNYAESSFPGLTLWSNTVTLTAGALTLDLTALTRTGLSTVNLNGKRILAVKIAALSTNTQPVTIVPGASNGYTQLGLGARVGVSAGAAASPATEKPDEVLIHCPSATAVDSTHKTLDLASAMATASVSIEILART